MDNNEKLQFTVLPKKTVILFAVFLGARQKQALLTITVDKGIFKDNKVILLPNKQWNNQLS